MNIYNYYIVELKNRLSLITLNSISIIFTSYYYKEIILFTLIELTGFTNEFSMKPYFIFTNVTELFYVYIDLILFLTTQICVSVVLYHLIIFLALGFYRQELRLLKLGIKIFILTWFFTLFLLYKLILPFSWSFFISFQQNAFNIQPISFFFEAKISDYLTYIKELYYLCLLCCFFLVSILAFLNWQADDIKKHRKLFYFIFVIFSTLITPPDVLSQIIISLTLITIYETMLLIKHIKNALFF